MGRGGGRTGAQVCSGMFQKHQENILRPKCEGKKKKNTQMWAPHSLPLPWDTWEGEAEGWAEVLSGAGPSRPPLLQAAGWGSDP